jgi:hypothetical protein
MTTSVESADFFFGGKKIGMSDFAIRSLGCLREVVWVEVFEFLDHYPADTASAHLDDADAAAFEFGAVAFAGDSVEAI